MANDIQLKRSSVAGRVPAAANVLVGEPVINLIDKIIFTKDGGGNVIIIGAGTSSNVIEGSNLYFSNARVSTAISSQTLGNATFSSVVSTGNISAGNAVVTNSLTAGTLQTTGNVNANNLRVVTNSSLGTVVQGTWNGSSISTTYTDAKVTSVNGQTGAATGFATTANSLSQFASTTSAQLAGVISDETGSGSLVFATTPTLVTPVLGLATGTSVMLSANIGAAAGNVSGNFTAGNFQTTGAINAASGTLSSATGRIGFGTDAGGSISLGNVSNLGASTPFLDFNSGATSVDYDSRILGSGGNGVAGNGTLTFTSATAAFTGNVTAVNSNFTGNVGFGVSTVPAGSRVAVAGTIGVSETGGTGGRLQITSTGSGAVIFQNDNSPIIFKTLSGTQEKMRIVDTGNVEITGNLTVSSGVSRLGTITSGTWNGSSISTTYTDAKVTSVNGQVGTATGFATTANSLSQFASTTSAQLVTLISDETGSGSLVFATTPTLVTPILGLATGTSVMLSANIGAAAGNVSGNFTAGTLQTTGNVNAGNLRVVTNSSVGTVVSGTWNGSSISTTYTDAKVVSVNGQTGAATGFATTANALSQFASTTSAQLAGIISDETGNGALVFATSPVLVTPILGLATGTSVMLSANIGAAAGNISGNFTAGNFQATSNVRANALVLVGSSSTSSLRNNDDITGWYLTDNRFDVSAQETAATGIFFKTDGTKMYIIGSSGDDITEYDLSTAWDITTATAVGVSINLVDTSPQDLYINSSGTKCYIVGSTDDTVREYNFGTAWQANTLSFVQSFSVSAQETSPTGITFKPDLTQMFICGSTGDGVDVYNLSSAGNVASAVFSTFVSLSQDTAPSAIQFNSDGSKFYMMGFTGDNINGYNLSTPYDLSTATFYNNSFYLGFIESTPNGMFLEFSQNKAWIVGSTSDAVREIDISGDGLRSTGNTNYFDNYVYVGEDFDVRGNAVVESQLLVAGTTTLSTTDVSGTFTPSSTVTMSTTTGTISIGTSQTTGTTLIGGTSQTGAISIGRSTVSQSINIGNGVTVSGNVKTLSIGTLGASGSNTNITIGSATSGANTSITMYGNVNTSNLSVTTASTLGTVQSGTWNGTIIATTYGGTGNSTGYAGGGAASAATATITNDTSTNSTHYITFTSASTGNVAAKVSTTKLTFNPSTGLLTSTDYNSSSDKRLKKSIKTIRSALDKVDALRGVSFEWKEGGAKAIGMIAQEVKEVLPEVVTTDDTGYMGIKYTNVIGVLVEAIKELKADFEAYKKTHS